MLSSSLPFRVHGLLDDSVAASSAVMPVLPGFGDEPEAAWFFGQGAGETVIAGISNYNDETGSRKRGERFDWRSQCAA